MDLRKLFTLLLSFWCIIVFAQSQEVISPLGKTYKNSTGSISFTLGEFINHTFSSPEFVLTQGFHQSRLFITDNKSFQRQSLEILVYPNPAKDFLMLKVVKYQECSYMLIDMTGKIIAKKEIVSSETMIDFNYLEPSLYVLKVLWKEMDARSFKITKY